MKDNTARKDEVLTVGKFESFFEVKFADLKDQIKSSAKATETGLRKEMQELRKELKGEIQDVKYELKGDICKLENKLEETRKELKGDIGRVEKKLDDMDTRIDDHEAKPVAIAHPAQG